MTSYSAPGHGPKIQRKVYKGWTTAAFSWFINHTDSLSNSSIREHSPSSSRSLTSTSTILGILQIRNSCNMHCAATCVLILAAIGLPTALGSPRPQIECTTWDDYKVTSQNEIPGPSQQGDYSVSGLSGSKSPSYGPSHRSRKLTGCFPHSCDTLSINILFRWCHH